MRVSTGSRDTKLHSGNLLVMTKCILSLCLMQGCKPRSESKINPWALTCWQEFDVSAHSFALRFTPIASVPATKASVFFWLSRRKKKTLFYPYFDIFWAKRDVKSVHLLFIKFFKIWIFFPPLYKISQGFCCCTRAQSWQPCFLSVLLWINYSPYCYGVYYIAACVSALTSFWARLQTQLSTRLHPLACVSCFCVTFFFFFFFLLMGS